MGLGGNAYHPTETLTGPMTPEQQKQFPADIAKLAAGRRLPR